MRLYLPDLDQFFRWLEARDLAYVVLRGHRNLGADPVRGSKADVDILVEDRAVGPDMAALGGPKRRGFKCDIYSETGRLGADYLGCAYLPPVLARSTLKNRIKWNGEFFIPAPNELFYSLLFHVCYQKGEVALRPGEPEGLAKTKYFPVLRGLADNLSIQLPLSLQAMHGLLDSEGYGLDYRWLAKYSQNDFLQGRKSFFYAWLADQYPGELNLYVLRATAVRRGFAPMLMETLKQHYQVLVVKDIPWLTRLRKARYMRGNKWRWGGWPVVAVAVFDPAPKVRTEAERKEKHPFVFNSRQFFKEELRERIVKQGRLHRKANALHSTDNEAEAIGRLNLFFTPEEEEEIYRLAGRIKAV